MYWKKYLKIALVSITVGSAIWTVYWFLIKNPSPAVKKLTEAILPSQETKPAPRATAPSKLQALTETPIFDYWLNKKTNDIYYLALTGEVVKKSRDASIAGETESVVVNSQTIKRLHSVKPSFDGSYAVTEFNYPDPITFSIFNIVTANWQVLPEKTISVAWSPNSSELLYLDNNSLNTLNLADKKTKKVFDLNQKDVNLKWLSGTNVLLMPKSTIELASTIWQLDLSKKTLTPIIENENGLVIQWSKDSDFGIKLSNKNRKPILNLINKNGDSLITFSFLTLPSKCLIENNKIYCGVPKNIKEGINLPDDYYKKAVYFDDVIYEIDLSTGSSKPIWESSNSPIDTEHLELDGNNLLFKNRLDEKLYSLQLD